MLQNEYLVAKIGFDTAENEPFKICKICKICKFAYHHVLGREEKRRVQRGREGALGEGAQRPKRRGRKQVGLRTLRKSVTKSFDDR